MCKTNIVKQFDTVVLKALFEKKVCLFVGYFFSDRRVYSATEENKTAKC